MPRYQARMSTKPARPAVVTTVTPFDFTSIPWSSEQTDIITWALTGTGNGIVDAVAGSGKTTVLCGVDHTQKYGLSDVVAQLLSGGCQFYAFGAKIADALKQRGVAASTFHSAGFKAFRGRFGYHKPSEYKYQNLLRDWAEDNAPDNCREENLEEQFKTTCKIWNMLRVNYLDITPGNVETIAGKYDCWTQDMQWTLKACQFFHQVMVSPKCLANYGIDFTDQIYIPVALDLHIDQHAFLLVDEAQDLNNLQRLLVRKMMLPGGRILFCGDPCQAIFGFAGADCDSMSKIAEEFETTSLPMYTCRRCCEAALELARQWNPHIVGKPGNDAGFVNNIYESGVAGTITGTDNMVVCRTTAPLLGMAFSLIRQGIGATVIGRDICDSILVSLKQVTNSVGYSWDDFAGSVDRFEQASVESLSRRKNSDQAIIAVQDRCACLLVIYDKCRAEGHLRGIPDLQETIKALFSDTNVAGKVTCTTIHRAKGLEAEYVYWLRPNLCPHPMAKTPESQLQERNLRYVAATRCKLGLYQVYEDSK